MVKTISRMPRHAQVIHHHHHPYYFNGGAFYTSHSGSYIRVVPPIGLCIGSIPSGYIRLSVGTNAYFYFEGVFYQPRGHSMEYVVVSPPIGAILYDLPVGTVAVEIGGMPFFEYQGIIYESVVYVNRPAYRVVGTLEG